MIPNLERRGRNPIDKLIKLVKVLYAMLIPMRCMGCGKPVAQLWEQYGEAVKKGEDKKKALDSLGLERYCCRALFLGHIDLIDTIAQFKKS
jgi:DNA-directed RNA polymerase subunit N (RpoN/RPB10)